MTIKRTILFLIQSIAFSFYLHASVISFRITNDGVEFKLDKGLMYIHVIKEDIVRVEYTTSPSIEKKRSLVVLEYLHFNPAFKTSENKQEIIITTNKLIIKINRASNAISYLNKTGEEVLSESGLSGKQMKDTTIAGIATSSCSTQFNSPSDEALFGLGCHPLDSLSINYKGRNQDLVIKYLTGAIPVLLSTRGYGLLWDNYSASHFYGAEEGNTQFSYVCESGKKVDYYFFYGPSFDQIINSYRIITGRAPMYPKWAFGLFQSQDRYKTQPEVVSVKDNYRNNHIPVDVIVQDWFYWTPLPIGSHVMNPERYPDPKKMVDELHKAHIHAMISIWPLFGDGTKNFDAMKKAGGLTTVKWDNFFVKTFDTYYDAHNPVARRLYWQQARDSLIKKYGWDAWWVDQCEPDNGELLDERRKALFATGRGIDYFNTYSLEHSQGLYENWRKDIPSKRAFFLIRQSFAGEQRNAATLWSSDITTTFSSLKHQIPQAINACVSGIPYWTSDIGGYICYTCAQQTPDWSKPEYRELFIRWFQFGAFSPIFRIHGKGERALFSKNWDDSTKAILLKYDNLRYRLLPYIYSLGAKVTRENYTIMRSLAFDFRKDRKVYSIPDEYLFGPAFLVSPVTEQLYTSKTAKEKTRNVYLPEGTSWFDFWTGNKLEGGQTISVSVPLEMMPLYVKAGSIVPMGPVMEYATEKKMDTIELRIYPGADGNFNLYEDENDNYNYEKGKFATIGLKWNDRSKMLTISGVNGSFSGMLKKRMFRVVIVGKANVEKMVRYEGKEIKLTVNR